MIKDYEALVEDGARTLDPGAWAHEHAETGHDALPLRQRRARAMQQARTLVDHWWQAGVACVPMRITGDMLDMFRNVTLAPSPGTDAEGVDAAIAATPYKPSEPEDTP